MLAQLNLGILKFNISIEILYKKINFQRVMKKEGSGTVGHGWSNWTKFGQKRTVILDFLDQIFKHLRPPSSAATVHRSPKNENLTKVNLDKHEKITLFSFLNRLIRSTYTLHF